MGRLGRALDDKRQHLVRMLRQDRLQLKALCNRFSAAIDLHCQDGVSAPERDLRRGRRPASGCGFRRVQLVGCGHEHADRGQAGLLFEWRVGSHANPLHVAVAAAHHQIQFIAGPRGKHAQPQVLFEPQLFVAAAVPPQLDNLVARLQSRLPRRVARQGRTDHARDVADAHPIGHCGKDDREDQVHDHAGRDNSHPLRHALGWITPRIQLELARV